ncbi:MAG: hypothetical protein ACXWYD_02505, partial [Candidatus Binatia bacterium]
MIVQDTPPASLPPLPSLPDESEEAAPVNVFAQLFNMFLAAPAPADSAANTEPSMLPAAAPASASEPVHLICAEVIGLDKKSLGIGDLPALPASEPRGFTIVESAATARTLVEPVLDTGQNVANAALAQEIGDTPVTDAAGAAPLTIARRPRRDGEPQVNELAETGWAGTPQMTLTQPLIGTALPAMFEASAKSDVGTDMRQSASPLNKSAGHDGSAMPRSPFVDMRTSLASETATAVESQSLVLLNQANDDLTTKQQVALPISATKAPSRSDDRDNLKAQSLRSENRASVTLNDSFLANVTAALKQSDG